MKNRISKSAYTSNKIKTDGLCIKSIKIAIIKPVSDVRQGCVCGPAKVCCKQVKDMTGLYLVSATRECAISKECPYTTPTYSITR